MAGFTRAALARRTIEFSGDRGIDAWPWVSVQAVARERGLQLMTADRVGEEGVDPRRVLLIATDWTADARRLLAQGARPAALISFESPVIAWSLYYHLEHVSNRFPHSFLFEGARDRVAPT